MLDNRMKALIAWGVGSGALLYGFAAFCWSTFLDQGVRYGWFGRLGAQLWGFFHGMG